MKRKLDERDNQAESPNPTKKRRFKDVLTDGLKNFAYQIMTHLISSALVFWALMKRDLQEALYCAVLNDGSGLIPILTKLGADVNKKIYPYKGSYHTFSIQELELMLKEEDRAFPSATVKNLIKAGWDKQIKMLLEAAQEGGETAVRAKIQELGLNINHASKHTGIGSEAAAAAVCPQNRAYGPVHGSSC